MWETKTVSNFGHTSSQMLILKETKNHNQIKNGAPRAS